MQMDCEKTIKCSSLYATAYAITIEDFKSKILIFSSVKEFFTKMYNIPSSNEDPKIDQKMPKDKSFDQDINIEINKNNLSSQKAEIEAKEVKQKKLISLRRNCKEESFKKLILGPSNKKWNIPLQLICKSRFLNENSKQVSGFNKDAFKKRSRDCWSQNFLKKFINLSGTSNPTLNEFSKNFKIGSSSSKSNSESISISELKEEGNEDIISLKRKRNKRGFLIWNFTHTNILL